MDAASTSSSHPQIFLFYIFFFRASWRIVYMRVFAFLKSNNFNFNFVSLEHMILSHFASKHLFIPPSLSLSQDWHFLLGNDKRYYFRTLCENNNFWCNIAHQKLLFLYHWCGNSTTLLI